jgi:hypothetical protein
VACLSCLLEILINKKAPLTGGGMGAGQISLSYEGIVRQRVRKLLTGYSIISTDHSNQIKEHFCGLNSFLNTSINKKPYFVLEVVIYSDLIYVEIGINLRDCIHFPCWCVYTSSVFSLLEITTTRDKRCPYLNSFLLTYSL